MRGQKGEETGGERPERMRHCFYVFDSVSLWFVFIFVYFNSLHFTVLMQAVYGDIHRFMISDVEGVPLFVFFFSFFIKLFSCLHFWRRFVLSSFKDDVKKTEKLFFFHKSNSQLNCKNRLMME